ncbi:hypothetical protein FQA39_LY12566 [Lamprigera yunnana]|nr:hypothetical protein FQA39_LY12566 [Lamprigera yunnana]
MMSKNTETEKHNKNISGDSNPRMNFIEDNRIKKSFNIASRGSTNPVKIEKIDLNRMPSLVEAAESTNENEIKKKVPGVADHNHRIRISSNTIKEEDKENKISNNKSNDKKSRFQEVVEINPDALIKECTNQTRSFTNDVHASTITEKVVNCNTKLTQASAAFFRLKSIINKLSQHLDEKSAQHPDNNIDQNKQTPQSNNNLLKRTLKNVARQSTEDDSKVKKLKLCKTQNIVENCRNTLSRMHEAGTLCDNVSSQWRSFVNEKSIHRKYITNLLSSTSNVVSKELDNTNDNLHQNESDIEPTKVMKKTSVDTTNQSMNLTLTRKSVVKTPTCAETFTIQGKNETPHKSINAIINNTYFKSVFEINATEKISTTSCGGIKLSKTNDITKIKGWRNKKFVIEPSTLLSCKKNSINNSKSLLPLMDIPKPSISSVFTSDILDQYLKESTLNISYEIPKLKMENSLTVTYTDKLFPHYTRGIVKEQAEIQGKNKKYKSFTKKSPAVSALDCLLKLGPKKKLSYSFTIRGLNGEHVLENIPFKRRWFLTSSNITSTERYVVYNNQKLKVFTTKLNIKKALCTINRKDRANVYKKEIVCKPKKLCLLKPTHYEDVVFVKKDWEATKKPSPKIFSEVTPIIGKFPNASELNEKINDVKLIVNDVLDDSKDEISSTLKKTNIQCKQNESTEENQLSSYTKTASLLNSHCRHYKCEMENAKCSEGTMCKIQEEDSKILTKIGKKFTPSIIKKNNPAKKSIKTNVAHKRHKQYKQNNKGKNQNVTLHSANGAELQQEENVKTNVENYENLNGNFVNKSFSKDIIATIDNTDDRSLELNTQSTSEKESQLQRSKIKPLQECNCYGDKPAVKPHLMYLVKHDTQISVLSWTDLRRQYENGIFQLWSLNGGKILLTRNGIKPSERHFNIKACENVIHQLVTPFNLIECIVEKKIPMGKHENQICVLFFEISENIWRICGICQKDRFNKLSDPYLLTILVIYDCLEDIANDNIKTNFVKSKNDSIIVFRKKRYQLKQLIPHATHKDELQIQAHIPFISSGKWLVVSTKGSIVNLSFTLSNFIINHTDIKKAFDDACLDKVTIQLSSPEMTKTYSHKNFGIYCDSYHNGTLFIGPYLKGKNDGIKFFMWDGVVNDNAPSIDGYWYRQSSRTREKPITLNYLTSDNEQRTIDSNTVRNFTQTNVENKEIRLILYLITNVPDLGYISAYLNIINNNVSLKYPATKKIKTYRCVDDALCILHRLLMKTFILIPPTFKLELSVVHEVDFDKYKPCQGSFFNGNHIVGKFGVRDIFKTTFEDLREFGLAATEILQVLEHCERKFLIKPLLFLANVVNINLLSDVSFTPFLAMVSEKAVVELNRLKKLNTECVKEKENLLNHRNALTRRYLALMTPLTQKLKIKKQKLLKKILQLNVTGSDYASPILKTNFENEIIDIVEEANLENCNTNNMLDLTSRASLEPSLKNKIIKMPPENSLMLKNQTQSQLVLPGTFVNKIISQTNTGTSSDMCVGDRIIFNQLINNTVLVKCDEPVVATTPVPTTLLTEDQQSENFLFIAQTVSKPQNNKKKYNNTMTASTPTPKSTLNKVSLNNATDVIRIIDGDEVKYLRVTLKHKRV